MKFKAYNSGRYSKKSTKDKTRQVLYKYTGY